MKLSFSLLLFVTMLFVSKMAHCQVTTPNLNLLKRTAVYSCDSIVSKQKLPTGGWIVQYDNKVDTNLVPSDSIFIAGSFEGENVPLEVLTVRNELATRSYLNQGTGGIKATYTGSVQVAFGTPPPISSGGPGGGIGDPTGEIEAPPTETGPCIDPQIIYGPTTTFNDTLTLVGDSNTVVIIKIYGNLFVGPNARLRLVGVLSNHIYWNIVGNITLNGGEFEGLVFAKNYLDTGSVVCSRRISLYAFGHVTFDNPNAHTILNGAQEHNNVPAVPANPQAYIYSSFHTLIGQNNKAYIFGQLNQGNTFPIIRDIIFNTQVNPNAQLTLSASNYNSGYLPTESGRPIPPGESTSFYIGANNKLYAFGRSTISPYLLGIEPKYTINGVTTYGKFWFSNSQQGGDFILPVFEFSTVACKQVIQSNGCFLVLTADGEVWIDPSNRTTEQAISIGRIDVVTQNTNTGSGRNLPDLLASNATGAQQYVFHKIDRSFAYDYSASPNGQLQTLPPVSKIAVTKRGALALLDVNGVLWVAGRNKNGEARQSNHSNNLDFLGISVKVPMPSVVGNVVVYDVEELGNGFIVLARNTTTGVHYAIKWGNGPSKFSSPTSVYAFTSDSKPRKLSGHPAVAFVMMQNGDVYGTSYNSGNRFEDYHDGNFVTANPSLVNFGIANLPFNAGYTLLPHLKDYQEITRASGLNTFFGTKCDGTVFYWGLDYQNTVATSHPWQNIIYLSGVIPAPYDNNPASGGYILPANKPLRSNKANAETCYSSTTDCLESQINITAELNATNTTYTWSFAESVPFHTFFKGSTTGRTVTLVTRPGFVSRVRLVTRVNNIVVGDIVRSYSTTATPFLNYLPVHYVCRGAAFSICPTNGASVNNGLVAWSVTGGSPSMSMVTPLSGMGKCITGTVNSNAPGGYVEYTITYDNNCTTKVQVYINLVSAGTNQIACKTSTSSITLTGASPSGGTWSGPYVSNGNFNVSAAPVGTYTVTYSQTSNGISCSATKTIEIFDDCGLCAESPVTVVGTAGAITTISSNTTYSGKLLIRGGIKVAPNATLTIASNAVLVFSPGNVTSQPANNNTTLCGLKTTPGQNAFIYIESGGKLLASKAVFRGIQATCGKEWQGILVESGAELTLDGATAEDIVIANAAEFGIRMLECGGNDGSVLLDNVAMRETMTGQQPLTVNPVSTKLFKFTSAKQGLIVTNSRFEWGNGLSITSPFENVCEISNNVFSGNINGISVNNGNTSFGLNKINAIANRFTNVTSRCFEVNTSTTPLFDLNLRCNLFEVNVPLTTTAYGIYVSSGAVMADMGANYNNQFTGALGNGWPIVNRGQANAAPPANWVSLRNDGTGPVEYFRANNEKLGLITYNAYNGFTITNVPDANYFSGPNPPAGFTSVCPNSPLYGGGYFRMGVTTDLLVDNDSNSDIQLWPNPASSVLNLKTEIPIAGISIINSLGQSFDLELIDDSFTQTLDISHLPKGIYSLHIITTSHGKIIKKFVKE